MSGHRHDHQRCRDRVVEVSTYLDGELSTERATALQRHLNDCPCCASFADSLRTAIATCRASGATELPPAVRRRARERIADLLGSEPPAAAPARSADTRSAQSRTRRKSR